MTGVHRRLVEVLQLFYDILVPNLLPYLPPLGIGYHHVVNHLPVLKTGHYLFLLDQIRDGNRGRLSCNLNILTIGLSLLSILELVDECLILDQFPLQLARLTRHDKEVVYLPVLQIGDNPACLYQPRHSLGFGTVFQLDVLRPSHGLLDLDGLDLLDDERVAEDLSLGAAWQSDMVGESAAHDGGHDLLVSDQGGQRLALLAGNGQILDIAGGVVDLGGLNLL